MNNARLPRLLALMLTGLLLAAGGLPALTSPASADVGSDAAPTLASITGLVSATPAVETGSVSLFRKVDGEWFAAGRQVFDGSGAYTFDPVEVPGEFTIFALVTYPDRPAFTGYLGGSQTLAAAETFTVPTDATTFEAPELVFAPVGGPVSTLGQVVDTNGEALPGARVNLLRRGGRGWVQEGAATANPSGFITFPDVLPPGEFTLQGAAVSADQRLLKGFLGLTFFADTAQTFTIAEGAPSPVRLPNLVLADLSAAAHGVVRSPSGYPLPGIVVVAYRKAGPGLPPQSSARTDANGEWSMDLPAADYKFSASSDSVMDWYGGDTSETATLVTIAPGVDEPIDIAFTPANKGTLSATPAVLTRQAVVLKELRVTGADFTPAATKSYAWLINGVVAGDQTGPTFGVPYSAGGKTVRARVTGSRLGYDDLSVDSAERRVPAINLIAPRISQPVKVGRTVRSNLGKWFAAGYRFSYQWLLNGKAITGETRASLALPKRFRGERITVVVIAKKSGFATVQKASVAKKVQ